MKDIVIKTSNNRILYYYAYGGICVKNLKSCYDNPIMIYPEAVGDFDVIEKENGCISVICQDNDGGIVYLCENEKSYLKSTLLKSKKQISYDKYFRMLKYKGEVYSFYIIEYEGKRILSFQQVEKENSLPYAVDEISNPYYFVFTDQHGVLYVFYEKDGICGYKYCVDGQWSKFDSIMNGRLMSAISVGEYIYTAVSGKEGGVLLKLDSVRKKCDMLNTGFFSESSDICLINENDSILIIKNTRGRIAVLKADACFSGFGRILTLTETDNLRRIRIKSSEYGCPDECYASVLNAVPKTVVYNLRTTQAGKRGSYHPESNVRSPQNGNTYNEIYGELNKIKIELDELKTQMIKFQNQKNENE